MFMFKHQRSAGTRLEVEARERGIYTSRLTACVYGDQHKLMWDVKLRGFYFIQSSHPSIFFCLHPVQGHRAAGWQAEYTLDSSISSVHIQHLTRYACFWMSESTLKGLSRPDSNPGRSCCEVTVHTALPMYSPAKEMHWAQREANV